MRLGVRFLYEIFTIGARQYSKTADMMRIMKNAGL